MTEYSEIIDTLDEEDRKLLAYLSTGFPYGVFIFIFVLWFLLLFLDRHNGLLIGMLSVFSVFVLFIPFIVQSMSKADLEDGKKRIITGILTKKDKTLNGNSSPTYYWEIANKRHIISRSSENFNNASVGDLIEVSLTKFGGQTLSVRKIKSEKIAIGINIKDWEVV